MITNRSLEEYVGTISSELNSLWSRLAVQHRLHWIKVCQFCDSRKPGLGLWLALHQLIHLADTGHTSCSAVNKLRISCLQVRGRLSVTRRAVAGPSPACLSCSDINGKSFPRNINMCTSRLSTLDISPFDITQGFRFCGSHTRFCIKYNRFCRTRPWHTVSLVLV